MTRKDFELIALTIDDSRRGYDESEEEALEAVLRTARLLSINLKAINPRFDRQRFLDACGFGN